VALAECGTHAVFAAGVGAYTASEATVTGSLLDRLEPRMLFLADRGFFSYALWRNANGTGADLLWRVRTDNAGPKPTHVWVRRASLRRYRRSVNRIGHAVFARIRCLCARVIGSRSHHLRISSLSSWLGWSAAQRCAIAVTPASRYAGHCTSDNSSISTPRGILRGG
jgi:hypothetical protein